MRRAKGGYLKKEYINTRISGIKSFCIDTGQCVGYYRHTFPGISFPVISLQKSVWPYRPEIQLFIEKVVFYSVNLRSRELIGKEYR